MTSSELFGMIKETRSSIASLISDRDLLVKEYYLQCIKEAGFEGKSVREVHTGKVGELSVIPHLDRGYEIRFYPYTKSGNLSKNPSKYFRTYYLYGCTVRDLQREFEIVQKTNGGWYYDR